MTCSMSSWRRTRRRSRRQQPLDLGALAIPIPRASALLRVPAMIAIHDLVKQYGSSPPSTASASTCTPARSTASSAQRRRQDDDAADDRGLLKPTSGRIS
jgi:hypothetical protein